MGAQIITDVMPRGPISALAKDAPFDVAKESLERKGYRVISLAKNANLRIQEGEDSDVSKFGNYVSNGVLYLPKKGIFLTPNSPIMKNAKEATQCHRDRNEFYLTTEQVEESLVGAVQLTPESIPTNRFGENEITLSVFGEKAKDYGEFLRNSKYNIKEMPIWLTNVGDKSFARQMWLFGLDGDGRNAVSCNGRVRGVRESAEGTFYVAEDFFQACAKAGLHIQRDLEAKIREKLVK